MKESQKSINNSIELTCKIGIINFHRNRKYTVLLRPYKHFLFPILTNGEWVMKNNTKKLISLLYNEIININADATRWTDEVLTNGILP